MTLQHEGNGTAWSTQAGFRARTADDYDRMWASMSDFTRFNPGARHRRRVVLKWVRGLAFERCIDVGCGKGDLILALRKQGVPAAKLCGADFSPQVVAENRQAQPEVRFEVLDIQASSLPGGEGSFDLVLCSEVIEHLTDRPAAIAHLAALLRPGGHLLLTCPTGRVFETERRFGHVSHPAPAEIRGLAENAGLRVERLLNWGWPLYRAGKVVTNLNADWSMTQFAVGRYSRMKRIFLAALYALCFLNIPSAYGCQLFALLRKEAAPEAGRSTRSSPPA